MLHLKILAIILMALLLSFSVTVTIAQNSSNQTENPIMNSLLTHAKETSQGNEVANKKEKFDLCLGMLKEYYNALDSRVEKSFALLIVVIGWLITSDTARKTLSEELTFFGQQL